MIQKNFKMLLRGVGVGGFWSARQSAQFNQTIRCGCETNLLFFAFT